jgi:hypothetical protein
MVHRRGGLYRGDGSGGEVEMQCVEEKVGAAGLMLLLNRT